VKVLLFIYLLLSGLAFAGPGIGDSSGGSSYSWKQIMRNNDLVPDTFSVQFEEGVSISYLGTCYIEKTDEIRSKHRIQTYNRIDLGDDEIFLPGGKKLLYRDRQFQKEICGGTQDECEWELIDAAYPLSANVEVRTQPQGDRSFGEVLFKKKYSLPNCK